jgi:hypothetical protein
MVMKMKKTKLRSKKMAKEMRMEKRRMKNPVRMNVDNGQDSEDWENESECDVPELFGSEDGEQD